MSRRFASTMLAVGLRDYSFDIEFFAMTVIKRLQSFGQIAAKALQVVNIARQIARDTILIGRSEFVDLLHGTVE